MLIIDIWNLLIYCKNQKRKEVKRSNLILFEKEVK